MAFGDDLDARRAARRAAGAMAAKAALASGQGTDAMNSVAEARLSAFVHGVRGELEAMRSAPAFAAAFGTAPAFETRSQMGARLGNAGVQSFQEECRIKFANRSGGAHRFVVTLSVDGTDAPVRMVVRAGATLELASDREPLLLARAHSPSFGMLDQLRGSLADYIVEHAEGAPDGVAFSGV